MDLNRVWKAKLNRMETEWNMMGKWNGKENGNKYLMAYRIKNIMSYEKRNEMEYRIKYNFKEKERGLPWWCSG